MKIKAIIFDTGGVLVEELAGEAREMLSEKFGLDQSLFEKSAKEYLTLSYKGKLEAVDFFAKILKDQGKDDANPEDLVNGLLEIRERTSTLNKDVKDTIEKLKKNYVVGGLSNTTELNEKVSVRKELHAFFEINIMSFQVGHRKPGKEIYELLLERLKDKGISASETIFVDDREVNLAPARELGINVILFESNEQLIRELKTLGVVV